MPEPNYTINLNASLSAAAASIGVGQFAVLGTGGYLPATAANRGTKRSSCIAISAASALGPSFVGQAFGEVSAEISGLAAGTASWVRVSATGVAERVVSPVASDDVVGWCETSGVLHLACGVLGPPAVGGVPTGTGFIHITAGVQDAAAKLVAATDITPGADNKVLLAAAGVATWEQIANVNVGAAAAIAGTKISPNFGSQTVATTGDVSCQDILSSRDVVSLGVVSGTRGSFGHGALNQLESPLIGYSTGNSPWSGCNGQSVNIDMADADHTATAAQYAHTMLKVVSPTNSAVRKLKLPSANNDSGYLKCVWASNCNGNALEVQDVAGGTSVTIADTKKAIVWVSAAGVERMGPDV